MSLLAGPRLRADHGRSVKLAELVAPSCRGQGGPRTMSHKPSRKRTHPKPKAVLRLPDLDQAKSAVLNSLTSSDAQRGYRHAIDEFVEWYCSEPRLSFNRAVVLHYRIHLESRRLAPGTVN